MSKTRVQNSMVEWNTISWKNLERKVFKLQKRIFKAEQRGDVKAVRKLQKTLIRSWSAKCLSVRRVTQDNLGKKTAGVDGIKNISPKRRTELVNNLKLSRRAKPTRRVWIPKPGTEEKRPLGIPTMADRALQALVKIALEPEWEAKFEPNSYGFRPGRSCHDAIEAIFNGIKFKPKFVLDADISKCFDRINHDALLRKLNTSPTIRRQVRAWLKAGVMEGKTLFPTSEGTPQGGVISPLLANIALHGLEETVRSTIKQRKYLQQELTFVRYADDFVVLHKDLAVVQRCQQTIAEWLKGMGLELKPSKTRITHTLNEMGENQGFDFLGFNIRQMPAGKCRTIRNPRNQQLGFTVAIIPSPEKVKQYVKKIGKIIEAHKAAPQWELIGKLNPIIRGWSNYYSNVQSGKIFRKIDHLIVEQLKSWVKFRHPNKGWNWIVNKYWNSKSSNRWTFSFTEKGRDFRLLFHSNTKINKYVKVQGNKSVYDGDWVYWGLRMSNHPEIPKRVAILIRAQKGKCSECGLSFKCEDLLEIDHKTPKTLGGKDVFENWQLIHKHCHHVKTTRDREREEIERITLEEIKSWFVGILDKNQVIEEPDEGKLSRPVLKTSRRGDSPA